MKLWLMKHPDRCGVQSLKYQALKLGIFFRVVLASVHISFLYDHSLMILIDRCSCTTLRWMVTDIHALIVTNTFHWLAPQSSTCMFLPWHCKNCTRYFEWTYAHTFVIYSNCIYTFICVDLCQKRHFIDVIVCHKETMKTHIFVYYIINHYLCE